MNRHENETRTETDLEPAGRWVMCGHAAVSLGPIPTVDLSPDQPSGATPVSALPSRTVADRAGDHITAASVAHIRLYLDAAAVKEKLHDLPASTIKDLIEEKLGVNSLIKRLERLGETPLDAAKAVWCVTFG